jgi:hypothetical protein
MVLSSLVHLPCHLSWIMARRRRRRRKSDPRLLQK